MLALGVRDLNAANEDARYRTALYRLPPGR